MHQVSGADQRGDFKMSVQPAADSSRLFLSLPTWIRASGACTNGTLSMIEQVIPAGYASPWHVHHTEDESFYVIEGQMTVVVADRSVALGPGGYAFGPRDIPHGFRIEGTTPARLLLITSGGSFAAFIDEMSDSPEKAVSKPEEIDVPKLIAAAARYHISILGPMPG
jgi:mannose-6-phosphate isomerase-like protein (cupin superfamily)